MTKQSLEAAPRKVFGRKVKQLRKEGIIPANVYGKKVKSLSIAIDSKDFEKVFKEAGETALLNLVLGKDKKAVLIRNVQKDPVEGNILHVDFQEVDLKAKVSAEVPVELVGESLPEKQGVGTVVQHINEVEVEALPAELPEKFEIDISALAEVDQAIYVKDIKTSDKVNITEDPERIVVKVEPPQKEEEVAPVVEEAVEGEEVPKEEGQEKEEEQAKAENGKESPEPQEG
jgi:large subunit ribosomal protein L25